MISREEEEELRREQQDYRDKSKFSKSKAILEVDQGHKALICEPLDKETTNIEIKIQIFKPVGDHNNYPYRTSQDYLGVVLNRKTDTHTNIQFQIQ